MKFTTGSVIGKLAKVTVIGTSYLVKGIGKVSEYVAPDEIKENIKNKTDEFADTINSSSSVISEAVNNVIDGVIATSAEITGYLSKEAAVALGASEETVKNAEKFGNIAGKIAIGGGIIGGAAVYNLVTGLAATGTAGASVITSGLAALGGGAVAAGGSGMAGGAAIALTITMTSAALAANTDNEKALPLLPRLNSENNNDEKEDSSNVDNV